jgi:methionyl-tRNA formyltransferase
MKIVFFGTANVALPILETLNTNHQVLAVVTTPDVKVGRKQELEESPVSALAKDLNLTTLKPEKVRSNPEFLEELKKLEADVFVVVAYGKILPTEIISLPQFKAVNVHFSVLPKYRGPSPIQAAMLNGDEETGTSVFVLNEIVDGGPLLTQKIVGIDPDDNYFTLADKLAKASAQIINRTLEEYAAGKLSPLPQDEAAATHTKIITKQDGKVSWEKSATEIYNQFRAFYIWPGIWTTWNGQVLKITECVPSESADGSSSVGTILEGGIVACGENTYLKINRLQLAGKNETSISEFLNGYQGFVGSRLGE